MNFVDNSTTMAAQSGRPAEDLRILVASHSHPRITNGGAEIAAFNLFAGFNARQDVEAWFLGCDHRPGVGRDGVALTQPFNEREFLYSTNGRFNWFNFANPDTRFPGELKQLLLELRPDIVHLHHYAVFGVDVLATIKRVLPQSLVVITLHEYQAICNHFGQMVKRGDFSLCDRSGLEACHKCFPEIHVSDFFIRDRYIRLFFDQVDHFVSPSHFLADRYAEWGVERSRISVVENFITPATPLPHGSAVDLELALPLRIGFFGQISRLKGIRVLLVCAAMLSEKPDLRISFDIYGDYRSQPPEFQQEFLQQLAKLTANVNYRGAYRQDQVDRLMRGCDAVLAPSIWWENSPVVIQEALRNRRPVICSDIGGMAEKVRDGQDGFHFPVGSALDLSYLLERLHGDRTILWKMRETINGPPSPEEVLSTHLALYRRLRSEVAA
jgi:glycosyltransferase involved in cell wall biosynthesis